MHTTNLVCRKAIKMDSLMLFMFYDPIPYKVTARHRSIQWVETGTVTIFGPVFHHYRIHNTLFVVWHYVCTSKGDREKERKDLQPYISWAPTSFIIGRVACIKLYAIYLRLSLSHTRTLSLVLCVHNMPNFIECEKCELVEALLVALLLLELCILYYRVYKTQTMWMYFYMYL